MRRSLLSLPFLLLTLAPVAEAQTVWVPSTFSNGSVADADAMNANVTAVVEGVNTALANRATVCAGAGGKWDAGTRTCIPASSYNCFIAGFCAQAAIAFPPATYGYTNVYEGDTPGAGDAFATGCNEAPSPNPWLHGAHISYVLPQLAPPPPTTISNWQASREYLTFLCASN